MAEVYMAEVYMAIEMGITPSRLGRGQWIGTTGIGNEYLVGLEGRVMAKRYSATAWLAAVVTVVGVGVGGVRLLQWQEGSARADLKQGDRLSPAQLAAVGITPEAKPTLTSMVLQGRSSSSGLLRVGNQSEHPIRIALLHRQQNNKAMLQKSKKPVLANEPVHWDFAPGEGGFQGLVLSVPQGDLTLQAGDVVVAFAQDGSRRYWGPFVVGETPLPFWNSKRSEWQLLINE
jgi:hypothetical protein